MQESPASRPAAPHAWREAAMKNDIALALVAITLAALSCSGPSALLDGGSITRQPAIQPDHPLYDRVEGTHVDNECSSDDDCLLGGCSGEVCSATEGVVTTCDVVAWPPPRASCGCVADRCIWYLLAGIDSATSDRQSADFISSDAASNHPVDGESPTLTGS